MLSRTSSLLPGALFTSLPGFRAEHLSDAKRVSTSCPSFALTPQPTSMIGHRSRPKASLPDLHLDRIRTALHAPAVIHRPPGLDHRSCRIGRRDPPACARDLRTAVRIGWSLRQRARRADPLRMRTRPFGSRRDRSAQGREPDRIGCWMICR